MLSSSVRYLYSPLLVHHIRTPNTRAVIKTSIPTVSHVTRFMTILSKQSAEDYAKQNYTERMMKTGRPVSPHVTIYQFPAVALSSITTRVTGCVLSFGAAGVGGVELLCGSGTSLSLMQDIAAISVLGSAAKFSVSFSVVYHYIAALRHLIWDSRPDLLTNIKVEQSAYIVLGSSVGLSGICMFL